MNNSERRSTESSWSWRKSILFPLGIFGSYALVALLLGARELAIAAAAAGVLGAAGKK